VKALNVRPTGPSKPNAGPPPAMRHGRAGCANCLSGAARWAVCVLIVVEVNWVIRVTLCCRLGTSGVDQSKRPRCRGGRCCANPH
jgi:hypothetical protein